MEHLRTIPFTARNGESTIENSKRRFEALTRATAQMVCICTPDGGWTPDQPEWENFAGKGEYAGDRWSQALHPDEVNRVLSRWKECIAIGKIFQSEHRLLRRDFTWRWFVVTVTPLHNEDGTIHEWLAIHADVTDRRDTVDKTTRALRELNDLKAAIDEHAIVAITDPQGKITYVNDKFCAISKYSREELIGQDHRIINSGFHTKQFIRNIWQTIGSGRVWKGEIKNRAKDGTFYWVDTTIVPYLGPEGKPIQYIAIRADITERKTAEKSLQKAQNELQDHAATLEQTVEARTAALRETIGELEAFSYSVSHDMRAPLRAMQSFSQILEEDCGETLDATGKEYTRRISSAAARMDGLIQDVLTYSRVSRSDLPMQSVDVGDLLREILQTYPSFQAPAANVEMEGEFPAVSTIPAVLTQCISNLLGNAIKFVEPGVIPHVKVWAENVDGGKAKIYFKDNGLGIDKEFHDIIFGIFQRVSKTYDGSGIGLSIVKNGAERMNGSVGLISEPGKGSTFWLELKKITPNSQ